MLVDIKKRIIRQLHVEVSSKCNAACPACPRSLPIHNHKEVLDKVLSLKDFKLLAPSQLLRQLRHIYFCGNYGDPLTSPVLLDIIRYIRQYNQKLLIGIHTNGSLRNESWWRELPSILGPQHYVVFSIDGLEDTNSIYRVNTQWSKIISNAKAFIENEGRARWHYLVFDHNEHQIDEAEQLSISLGFEEFTPKYSTRKLVTPKVDKETHIVCKSIRNKELYLGADGRKYPCCHLASYRSRKSLEPYINYESEEVMLNMVNTKNSSFCYNNCSMVVEGDRVGMQFKSP